MTPVLLGVFPTITPNQVTIAAFAVVRRRGGLVAHAPVVAAVFVTAASVLDGSDGEIARLAPLVALRFVLRSGPRPGGGRPALHRRGHLPRDLGGPRRPFGSAQVPVVIAIAGLALVGHLLVSYTTAKAAVDLGHRYHGVLLGAAASDLRLLILTLGALGAAVHASSLLAALAVVGSSVGGS